MQRFKQVILVLIALLAVGLASGLIGRNAWGQSRSSSDAVAPTGRYQLVVANSGTLYIFDTQSGRLWEHAAAYVGQDPGWTEHSPDYSAAGSVRKR